MDRSQTLAEKRPVAPEKETAPERRPSQPALQPVQRKSPLPWLIFWIIVIIVGILAWRHWDTIESYISSSGSQTQSTARQKGAGQSIPVVAATAKKGNIRIYFDGLGSVTPFATVTLKTQVNGQIFTIYYREGQLVKRGDPLLDIDPRPYQVQLEQANGKLASDKAYLDNAKIDLDRYQSAYSNGGAVSDQVVATQKALVDQYVGNVLSDQAAVDSAKLDLIYCHITSPIDGRIGLQLVNLGNYVQTSDTTGLAIITQLQPIALVFALPEDDLQQVMKTSGGVGLPVDAYDHDDQQLLATGTVVAVDNEVSPNTATFNVKATFANKDSSLFPNEFVNAHLLVDTKRGVTVVPAAAVQNGPDGTFVYLFNSSDQTVHVRNVQVGPTEGDIVSLTGIQPGDVVVTDGTDKLQDGSKVTPTMQDFGAAAGSTTQPAHTGHRRHAASASDTQPSGGSGQ
jgi:membrane fusion protein, multidrug efflux system